MNRVLMTADTVGGVWTYAMELGRELAGSDVEVHLATMGELPSEDQRAEAAAIRGLHLHASRFRLEWMEDPWQDVDAAGVWLLELERRLRPFVVHLNGFAHGRLPFRAPVVVVAHSCVPSWWRAVKGEEAPPSWAVYRERVARGLRAADLVVAPTRAAMRWTDALYGPLDPLRVAPNGRRAEAFPPLPKRPYVAAAGRVWDEAKNLAVLGTAARELPWPVRVAGPERGPGGERAATTGLAAVGRLDRQGMARFLGSAAIFAHPALYEPFGLSVLEAALAGCALVLADIPSLRELWEGTAELVPPRDPEAWKRELARLVEDPARREELAARSRRRARELTPEAMAERYRDLYREAAAPHRRPPRSLSIAGARDGRRRALGGAQSRVGPG